MKQRWRSTDVGHEAMFKKPPQLKPASPLRSSSRRSFLAHLQTLYPALADAPPELLSQLVPNGLRHGGATTSGGQKAVIYTNESGKPLWFELGPQAGSALQQSEKNNKKGSGGSVGDDKDKLFEVFPTIYALWIAPDVLPRLPTWPQIVDPTLLSGSALMIPGCIPQPHTFPPHLQHASSSSSLPPKSATIAITPYPSPVPLVVARLDADMQDIVQRRASGEKGKAATTIHAYGDFLWELGGKGEPPKPEAHLRDSSFNNTNDLHGTEKASQGLKVVEKEADATINFAEDNDEEGLEHATNASTFAVQGEKKRVIYFEGSCSSTMVMLKFDPLDRGRFNLEPRTALHPRKALEANAAISYVALLILFFPRTPQQTGTLAPA